MFLKFQTLAACQKGLEKQTVWSALENLLRKG